MVRAIVEGRQTAAARATLFLHPGGAVSARVGMRDAAPDGMRLSGQAATEHREELPPRWSVGITAGQTSSEVHEAIARFR